jgi:hypothetical protein
VSSPEACADLCRASGETFFIFGIGSKAGNCYSESTTSPACPEGFETDQYDFYELVDVVEELCEEEE